MRWLDDITHSMDMSFGKFWEIVKHREAWCVKAHGAAKSRTQLRTNTHENPIKPWLRVNLFKEDWHLCPKLVMSKGQLFIF